MKQLKWIAWISGGFGFLFILLGLIQMFYGLLQFILGQDQVSGGRLFGDTEIVNFFIVSSNFFLITIAITLLRGYSEK